MKNPPGGGHRASRDLLASKVDLGLSEIVESNPEVRLGYSVAGMPQDHDCNHLDNQPKNGDAVLAIDSEVGASGRSWAKLGHNANAGEVDTAARFQDVELHLQVPSSATASSAIDRANSALKNPIVDGKHSLATEQSVKSRSLKSLSAEPSSSPPSDNYSRTVSGEASPVRRKVFLGLISVVFLVACIAAFRSSGLNKSINLGSQLSLLSSSENDPNLSFRSLGITSDLVLAKGNSGFILQDLDAIRLSVSDLDAVAYKMQRDEGAAVEVAKADSSKQENGEAPSGSNVDSVVETGSSKGKKSSDRTASEPVNSESSTRLSAKENTRGQIEINTSGPLEPRLPERESPSVAEEYRDPFARESVSPSPDLPRGNEVRPVFEEPFTKERIFKVQSDTTVRSKPSVFGEDLAELRAGDSVLAVSKVGQWVRIRSKRGLSGFVLDKALAAG